MHSWVRFLSRFILFATTLRILLLDQVGHAAGATPGKLRVLFLGVLQGSSEEQQMVARVINVAVAARLTALGFDVVEAEDLPALPSAPFSRSVRCSEGSCLSARAAVAGTDFALTGSVLRINDLCSADLWLFDRHRATIQRAEIACTDKTPDSALADEFAEHAGRLEAPSRDSSRVASAASGLVRTVPRWGDAVWNAKRSRWPLSQVATAYSLGLGAVFLTTLALSLAIPNCNQGPCMLTNPTPGIETRADQGSAVGIAAGALAAASLISLAVPWGKR